MPITQLYTGSATIGTTEFSLVNSSTTLASNTNAGVYQVFIDFVNLTGTEEYNIKIKEKVTSGGVQRTIYNAQLEGVQTSPFVTPSLILMHGWDVTVTKVAGTDRAIAWSIRQVA